MQVHTVLFDADGVLQRPMATRPDAWRRVLGSGDDLAGFVAAVFGAEDAALTGREDFVARLRGVLRDWKCRGTIDDALATWTMIEPDRVIADIITALRRGGVTCCLATNQEPFRARYMSGTLEYGRLFDREFYSCRLGVAKPAIEYFETILSVLEARPEHVLFIDDREENVDAAQATGLNAAVFNVDSGPAGLLRTLRTFGIVLA